MNLLANARKTLTVYASALTLGLSAAFIASPTAAQESVTWKVQSHWPGSSSSYTDSLGRIKRVLEERTDGRLKLQLYEAGALFKATDTFNAVSRGILEMGTISPAYAQDKVSRAVPPVCRSRSVMSGKPPSSTRTWGSSRCSVTKPQSTAFTGRPTRSTPPKWWSRNPLKAWKTSTA